MISVGIDDTDTIDTRGTNKLALQIVQELKQSWCCHQILRHQLFLDQRVPFTSQNGSASLLFTPLRDGSLQELLDSIREIMLREFIPGSDPGLAVAESVPIEIQQYGQICKLHLTTQADARMLAERWNIRLEGLGGTNDGIIGALAAIGLAATQDDGRIIYLAGWNEPLEGIQPVSRIRELGVCVVCEGTELLTGDVMLHKKLRPNRRNGQNILYVERTANGYEAIKLP